MRRTEASLVYKLTKNLREMQIFLGHAKPESTRRYLGIEVNDALEMAEETDICSDFESRCWHTRVMRSHMTTSHITWRIVRTGMS